MHYLPRLNARPSPNALSEADVRFVHSTFDPYAGEVLVYGEAIRWNELEEIEVVLSPRASGAAGWLVRHVVHGDERYHVGLYYNGRESVLPNVTQAVARYVVQCVAYYAPLPVRYQGPDDMAPLTAG